MTTLDTSPPLDAAASTGIRKIVGMFLYYAHAFNNTMLVALGTMASQQASATDATAHACIDLLNYAASHPEGIVKDFERHGPLQSYGCLLPIGSQCLLPSHWFLLA